MTGVVSVHALDLRVGLLSAETLGTGGAELRAAEAYQLQINMAARDEILK